jgi:hypothetical protein
MVQDCDSFVMLGKFGAMQVVKLTGCFSVFGQELGATVWGDGA